MAEVAKLRAKPSWRFTLRGLIAVMLLIGVALGLWAPSRSPIINRGYHPNGKVAWEHWQIADRYGNYHHIKTVRYYSNGPQSFERGHKPNSKRYWLPSGELTTDVQAWRRARESDGEGIPVLAD
jgi:hypothetical protein